MLEPTWRFREKQRAEMHQESAHTEFFAQQDVADRLVREAGQNTLDASRDRQTTHLVFAFTTAQTRAFDVYFSDLWPHLEAQRELREALPEPEAPIPCLLVEDFGTTGLTGPLEPHDRQAAEQHEAAHRLFWFFKNVGRTSKSGEQLGSFGIGKTVFPYSSRINTFFGFSVREASSTDASAVMLGQSHLREHRIGDSGDLDPFGFFAWHEGRGVAYEQRAISEPPLLEQFRAAFGLTRSSSDLGLSVVIPYPDFELTPKAIAKAAIIQFFLPILSRRLTIDIRQEDRLPITLSTDTLLEAIDQFDWTEKESAPLRNRIRLASWALTDAQSGTVELARPSSTTQPKFDEAMLANELRANLSKGFVAGHRIALKVPVPVEPKGKPLVYSYVEVFLEYDRTASNSDDIYAREGLTLVEHQGLARQTGLRSILIAHDPPIAKLLRSSENVAHTRWRQRGAALLSQDYVRGPSKVSYVLGLVPGIVQAILSPQDTADWWTLSDLFPEPESSPMPTQPLAPADAGKPRGEPDDDVPTEEQDVDIPFITPSRIRQWRATATRGRLRIERNPAFEGNLRPMRLAAAYGLLNRRGFSAHNSADFSFQEDPQIINAEGAEIQVVSHNVLEIQPTNSTFRIEISGFDRHRALDYRVSVLEGD